MIDDDRYILTASSEDADYPIVNVQQPHLSLKWHSTGITDEWIKLETTIAASTNRSVYLAGTNLSNTAIVKIQGNDTDVWTAPTVDITMKKEGDIYYSYDDGVGSILKYWRFSIVDIANTDGYISIGRAWFGKTIEVRGPYTDFVERRINTSATTISISGQPYTDVGYVYNEYEMTYPYWNNTEKGDIETFADTVNKGQPFFAQFVGENNCQLGPLYLIMTNNMDFNHMKTLDIWSSKMSFVQTF